MTPKRPLSKAWHRTHNHVADGTIAEVWTRKGLRVLSSLDDMSLPQQPDDVAGPTWMVSASYKGRRCSDKQLKLVRAAFDMREAEEDNHMPGISRGLFLVVAPADRADCDCKASEDIIVEPDGYEWTNPKPGEGACRGCELQGLTGRACPLHGERKP